MIRYERFHGPVLKAPWDMRSGACSVAPKKGDPIPTWRCPDCHSIELSEFALLMNHGWNVMSRDQNCHPTDRGMPEERPCAWALEEEGLELCLRQLRAIGGRRGVECGKLPPLFPGIWIPKGTNGALVCALRMES